MSKQIERLHPKIRPAEERKNDFGESVSCYTQDEARREGSRCLKCAKPFCKPGCAAEVDIPQYLGACAQGDFNGALKILMDRMPLPAVCGRVCPHKCESKCIKGKKGEPVAIEFCKRAAADYATQFDVVKECGKAPSNGKKIAVIGSGPGGLASAFFLAKKGYACTIFEQKSTLGGMCTLCIPTYRLPREALNQDIDRIKQMGVEMITNKRIEDVSGLLTQGYSAVVVAAGTLKEKKLGIPGEDLKGVEHVIPFLESINCGGRKTVGKKVAVVGAGFSAMDAVRSAKRLGSDSFIVYRRMREQMPASVEEVDEAEEEGCKLHILRAPVRIVGDANGNVCGIEVLEMALGEPDSSGRPAPVVVPGTEQIIECDMVIQAISQDFDATFLKEGELQLSKWATIEADQNGKTSKAGIYAVGDNCTGPQTIVQAVGSAYYAAIAVDEYVKSL